MNLILQGFGGGNLILQGFAPGSPQPTARKSMPDPERAISHQVAARQTPTAQ